MEAQTIFYIGGGLLVVAALLISFIGIRGKDAFPPSGGVMTAGVAVFAVLVAGTAAYAVASAREEQEHRDEELAEAEVEAEEGVSQAEAESEPEEGTQEGEPPPIGQQTPSAEPKAQVDLTSPEDGSLEFEPGAIQAKPGTAHGCLRQPFAGLAQRGSRGRAGRVAGHKRDHRAGGHRADP